VFFPARNPVLLIAPFENTEHSPALGLAVARLFIEQIVQRSAVQSAGIIDDPQNLRALLYRDIPAVADALGRARRRGADLLLVGSVPEYRAGSAGPTAVTVVARLIDVESGAVVWWGRSSVAGRPGRRFLLWDMRLDPDPPDADTLTRAAVRRIVKKMLPPGAAARRPAPFHEEVVIIDAPLPDDHAVDMPAEPAAAVIPESLPGTLPPRDPLDLALEELHSLTRNPGPDDIPTR